MKLGFTGTRDGLTPKQREMLDKLLAQLHDVEEAHHGDCVGGDETFHDLVRKHHPQCVIYAHPPNETNYRAYTKPDHLLPEKGYLDRDDDIAKACDRLIACPRTHYETQRSGTWATVRRARKYSKGVTTITPDGAMAHESRMCAAGSCRIVGGRCRGCGVAMTPA